MILKIFSQSHYQKRAYQCIKLLTALFSSCRAAKAVLDASADTRRKWTWAVDWLNDALEKDGGGRVGGQGGSGAGGGQAAGQYSYANWNPPAASNETANGYYLERSLSARHTLDKACELLPEEEVRAIHNSTYTKISEDFNGIVFLPLCRMKMVMMKCRRSTPHRWSLPLHPPPPPLTLAPPSYQH